MQKSRSENSAVRHKSRRGWIRALIVVAGLGALGVIGVFAGVIGAYHYVRPSLPQAETIQDIPLQVPLRIYSRDGRLISEIGQRRRVLISYEDVPEHVVNAFIAAEDRRFWEHPGLDYVGLLRALFQLATRGEVEAGGSTLTQQLARDYFLNLDRTIERKFKEGALAVRLEQEFSKQQIMELFLNKMFFGQRAYGVSAAAQVFFGKELEDLNIAEAATLAGVLPAPSRYNPVRSAANAEMRRGYVLGRMRRLGFISEEEYDEAMALPMESQLHGANVELNAPYVAEMVRREMLKRYGEDTYTAGYQVVTTLDTRLQQAANYAVRNGLLEFTRRRGFRPVPSIELDDELLATPFVDWPPEVREVLEQYAPGGLRIAIVTAVNEDNSVSIVLSGGTQAVIPWHGLSWAKAWIDRETTGPAPETAADVLTAGDVIHVMPTTGNFWALAQVPQAQSAFVAVDPNDGAIGALTGGFDFAVSKFNRATQAYRQPGSSFKPFIYSAALEHGNTAATVVLDAPVVINSSELEAVWRPINYSGRFYGPTRLREALYRSMNLVSVRLLIFETGIGNAVRHIAKFGFPDAALPHNGSLALGAGNASPLDMAQGYAILANGGHAVKPYVIDAIYGPTGDSLYRVEPAVVCLPCEAEPDPRAVAGGSREAMTLEQMAEIALDYRPDASLEPEMFADISAAEQVITKQNAFLISDMMRDVIRRGTGVRARVLGRSDLSGKTGTSNDRRDAWFGGFNADLAAVVWVGFDDDLPLGPREEGSRTALPVWIDFARIALKGVPEHQLPMPEGIVSVLIDRETGCPARAGRSNVTFEVFREGHVPECEVIEELPDVFNEPAGIDETDETEDAEEETTEESLF
ncbi:MAG: penicillin-binding protein 1A [Woeseiaceae bacterium]|nr:penicillin-binding protein 1A [Woeseiaceae bacterium]